MQNVFLVSDVYLYVIGVAIILRLAPTQKLRTVLLILSNLFILTFLASYREIIIATLAYAVLCIAFAEGLYRFRDKGFAKAVTLGCSIAVLAVVVLGLKYPVYSRIIFGGLAAKAPGLGFEWIGLSFLTFRAIDLIVYYGSGRAKAVRFDSALAYLTFFPTFVAGPINRFEQFDENLDQPSPRLSLTEIRDCTLRASIGIIKMTLLARIAWQGSTINTFDLGSSSGLSALFGLYLYYFYIYLDFSGYCDVAISVGRLMGFRIPENFNFPFLAVNIQEFWNRWHSSLTAWCRDYIFFVTLRLQLLKLKAIPRTIALAISMFITFCFMGAWHGDAVNWLLYGVYHGIGMITWYTYQKVMEGAMPRFYDKLSGNVFYSAASAFVTFNFVAIGLVLTFDLPKATYILHRLAEFV